MTINVVDHKTSIEAFLEATAATRAMPAAGCCAALAGALSAALGHMVMSISAVKEPSSPVCERRQSELSEFARAQQTMTRLIADDQNAYSGFLAARRMPETDSNRPAAIQHAVAECIGVPETLAHAGVSILESYRRAIELTPPLLQADLSACADLAMTAVRVGVNLMKVNASGLTDANRRAAVVSTADVLFSRALKLIQQR